MKDNLNKIIELTYSHSDIERDIYYPNRERKENDSEHSYQMTVLAWNIIEKDNLDLNLEEVMKICLAHDLVEVYSGDVPLWGKDGHNTKEQKELEALETIEKEFSGTPSLADSIRDYKELKTKEAKFVKAIDKLVPFINQLNTAGKIWKENNVSFDVALEYLNKVKDISEYLSPYFEERIKFLEENKAEYFNS